jgi:hypothetical protein
VADKPSPTARPADGPEPQADAQPVTADPAAVEPTKSKPVVLATRPLEQLRVRGEDGADDVVITPTGTALTKTDAKRVQEVAAVCGVELLDLTADRTDDSEKG